MNGQLDGDAAKPVGGLADVVSGVLPDDVTDPESGSPHPEPIPGRVDRLPVLVPL